MAGDAKDPSPAEILRIAQQRTEQLQFKGTADERARILTSWGALLSANHAKSEAGSEMFVKEFVKCFKGISDPELRIKLITQQWQEAKLEVREQLEEIIARRPAHTDLLECIDRLRKAGNPGTNEIS